MARATLLLLILPASSLLASSALVRPALPSPRARVSLALSEKSSIFDSAGWPAVQKALNRLPVFTCANEEGQPIQYERNGTPLAVFYADIEAAKGELQSARAMYPELPLELIPLGLGSAFKLTVEGKAILVPGASQLAAAGAPAGASPMGQMLPLFACLEMCQEDPDGKPMLPLFMCHMDAEAAVAEATAIDGAEEALQITCLSLEGAVQQLVTVPDTPAFTFIPPKSSIAHIEEYLKQ